MKYPTITSTEHAWPHKTINGTWVRDQELRDKVRTAVIHDNRSHCVLLIGA